MRTRLALWGFSACALVAMLGQAEARRVFYEIDGQRYSYSTRNRAQVREARERIQAADAASAARTRSEAESAGNPLAKLLTPSTQAAAASAQQPATGSEPATVEPRKRVRHSRAERTRLLREARVEKARQRREAIAERRRLITEKRAQKLQAAAAERRQKEAEAAARAQPRPAPSDDKTPVVAQAEPAQAGDPGDPMSTQSLRKAAPKTISFDLASGIKTIERTDGSLHEEPFDSAAVAKLGLSEGATDKGLADFVDQIRTK